MEDGLECTQMARTGSADAMALRVEICLSLYIVYMSMHVQLTAADLADLAAQSSEVGKYRVADSWQRARCGQYEKGGSVVASARVMHACKGLKIQDSGARYRVV